MGVSAGATAAEERADQCRLIGDDEGVVVWLRVREIILARVDETDDD